MSGSNERLRDIDYFNKDEEKNKEINRIIRERENKEIYEQRNILIQFLSTLYIDFSLCEKSPVNPSDLRSERQFLPKVYLRNGNGEDPIVCINIEGREIPFHIPRKELDKNLLNRLKENTDKMDRILDYDGTLWRDHKYYLKMKINRDSR